ASLWCSRQATGIERLRRRRRLHHRRHGDLPVGGAARMAPGEPGRLRQRQALVRRHQRPARGDQGHGRSLSQLTRMRSVVAAGALRALAACTPPPAQTTASACVAPLKPALQVDLYFGAVGEAEWRTFLDQEVTPRFPDGLSVIDAYGQYRNRRGTIERERAKL